MHPRLSGILLNGAFVEGADGIYSATVPVFANGQEAEMRSRERVAAEEYSNYLSTIARHHSVPVMDYEVDRFLSSMPDGALVLDIGGCWGWHWRRLASTRPDVAVLIVDFVRANLGHARRVLGSLVGSQVGLVHADALNLPFADGISPSAGFDGIWTVQTFQHVPEFARACREARRVLRPGGRFVNYSLHMTPLNRMIYRMLGKPFHKEGTGANGFQLNRASDGQREIVAAVFGGGVAERYTECLFHPDLGLASSGGAGRLLGRIDARLGEMAWVGRWIARQRSFEVTRT